MTILDRILKTKRREVAVAKQRCPMGELRAAMGDAAPPRDFYAAVTSSSSTGVRLIAELKKSSPSAGLIVPDFDPVAIARTYADHGAAALSVLTDQTYFQGRLEFLGRIKREVSLPILRKDFIIDEYQLWESRLAGADAVLLIAAAISPSDLALFVAAGQDLAISVLVEVHTIEELETVLEVLGDPRKGAYLLGVNNRDLHVQRTALATTPQLAAALPQGTPFVSESGITTRDDVLAVQRAGACAILVGESLLRAADAGRQIDLLLGRTC